MLTTVPPSQAIARLDDQWSVPQRPFGPALDQRLLYPSRSYVTVLTEVRRALQQREGLVVVTGEPGTGKTMLCRTLLQELDPGICVSVVLDPRVTIEDLLLHVLADFGVISSSRQHAFSISGAPTRHQLMRALQHFLASLVPAWGCAVLVIDEAHDLNPGVLDELRLLLNLETDEAKLLQVVLIGQPALAELLRDPALRQLDERVARRCELKPLLPREVPAYIKHRLTAAGSRDVTFAPAAVRSLVRRSAGIPRTLNALCDRALDMGCRRGTRTVSWQLVRAAAERSPRKSPLEALRTPAVVGTAAALALATGVGLGAHSWRSRSESPPVPLPPAFAGLNSQVRLSESMPVHILRVIESDPPPGQGRQLGAASRSGHPRFTRVTLFRTPARTSLAFELTAEPEKAALRRLSERAIELETGPVTGPLRAEQFAPVSDAMLLRQVSIQQHLAQNHATYMRARLILNVSGGGDVRVVGRTVFVDLTPLVSPELNVPARPRPTPQPELPRVQRVARVVVAQAPQPSDYRQAVAPWVQRLTEIAPFLTSAAATPGDDVRAAMGRTLTAVEQPLKAMDVPRAAVPAHTMLLSSVEAASRAVAFDFKGDRVAQAHQALALLDAAKSQIP
jgi:type II secretory pathway predicted ATPase ExeA